MEEREARIRLWFQMWLQKEDLGILELFSEQAVYVESWGPKYEGAAKIKLWFEEWNTRATVLQWKIKQFFHCGNQTVVEWYFENIGNGGETEAFDGMSLIVWTQENQIRFLKEFGCNIRNYDPYENGTLPQFREEAARWF